MLRQIIDDLFVFCRLYCFAEIVQINMVVAEYGPKPIEELLNGGEEKTE